MRHMKTGRKLSRRKEHRTSMLANLAASLIKKGRVRTTDAKAKEIRPFVERMVTFAKRGDLHARRIVLSRLRDAEAVKKLFDELGPRYTERPGGYTRILKLGFRHGDNSPISLIEFVTEDMTKKKPARKATKSSPKKAAPAEPSAPEAVESEKPAGDDATVEAEEASAQRDDAVEETVADEAVTDEEEGKDEAK